MPEELSFMAQITQRKEDERNRLLEEAAEAPLQRPVEFTGPTTREQLLEEQTKSMDSLFGAVAELGYTHRAIGRAAERQDIRDDGGNKAFEITDDDLKGIPSNLWDRFEDVINQDEFDWVRARIIKELELEEELQKYSMGGLPARLLMGITDPVSLALMPAVGAGWLYKGARMARVVKSGVMGAAANASLVGALKEGSPTLSGYNILFAAGIGAFLGGAIGSITPKAMRAANKWKKATVDYEARVYAREGGADIPEPKLAVYKFDGESNDLVPAGNKTSTEIYDDPTKLSEIIYDENPFDSLKVETEGNSTLISAERATPRAGDHSKLGSQEAGKIELIDRGERLQVINSAVEEEAQRVGNGRKLYDAAARRADEQGKTLVSDTSVSESAARVWVSMKKAGHDIIDQRTTNPDNIETIVREGKETQYKTNNGTPVFERRAGPVDEPLPEGGTVGAQATVARTDIGEEILENGPDEGTLRVVPSDGLPEVLPGDCGEGCLARSTLKDLFADVCAGVDSLCADGSAFG